MISSLIYNIYSFYLYCTGFGNYNFTILTDNNKPIR